MVVGGATEFPEAASLAQDPVTAGTGRGSGFCSLTSGLGAGCFGTRVVEVVDCWELSVAILASFFCRFSVFFFATVVFFCVCTLDSLCNMSGDGYDVTLPEWLACILSLLVQILFQ